jgi:hypothetical protein
MDELKWFRQAILRAYPNPQRFGCPSPDALEGMARRTVPMSAAEQEHIFHCSPCFSTYLGIRNQIRRDRIRRVTSIWALSTVLVAVITYFGYRVLHHSPAPQEFATAFNFQDRPVFRGPHQAAVDPSPFVLPRGIVLVSVTLPLGSQPGLYQLEIYRDGQTHPLLTASGQAVVQSNGSTVPIVHLDSSKLGSGQYQLGVGKNDSDWSYSALVLR